MVQVHVSDSDNDDVKHQQAKETFTIHKDIICYYSPFFDGAFNREFEEGVSQEVHLRDVQPACFSIFVDWLYSQTVTMIDLDTESLNEFECLVRLWVLADRLLLPRLQNATLRALAQTSLKLNRAPHTAYKYVYSNTADASPLRRYCTALYVMSCRNKSYVSELDSCPRQMLVDIINEMHERTDENKLPHPVTYLKTEGFVEFYVDEDN